MACRPSVVASTASRVKVSTPLAALNCTKSSQFFGESKAAVTDASSELARLPNTSTKPFNGATVAYSRMT